jgi:hypothetical protein
MSRWLLIPLLLVDLVLAAWIVSPSWFSAGPASAVQSIASVVHSAAPIAVPILIVVFVLYFIREENDEQEESGQD